MPNKKIRVAQVIRPAAGGMRQHLATLIANLDRKRFDITVFAPDDFAPDAAAWQIPHVSLDIAPRTSFLQDRATIHELAQHLSGKFDLIHAHGIRGAWIGALATSHEKLPCVFTAHNLVSRLNPFSRFGLNYAAQRYAHIIAVSEAVSDSLQQNGVDGRKIVVIPNGIVIASFDAPFDAAPFRAKQNIPHNAPLIVAVGRLSPEKGFDVLLRCFPLVQPEIPDAHLILVGAGAEQARLAQIANGNHAVHLSGFADNVNPFLKIADVVVVPSRREGQGIVALEAMAARKPVVASRVGGLVETVVENETGLLVPPDDAHTLAKALISLLQDSQRRAALGEAGRRRVEQSYTAKAMAAQISALYEEFAV